MEEIFSVRREQFWRMMAMAWGMLAKNTLLRIRERTTTTAEAT